MHILRIHKMFLFYSLFTPERGTPKQVLMYDLKVVQSGELAAQMFEEGYKEETHLRWDLKGEEILSSKKGKKIWKLVGSKMAQWILAYGKVTE